MSFEYTYVLDVQSFRGAECDIDRYLVVLNLGKYWQHKPCFDEECLGFYIKGSRLKCTGYGIQVKAM